MLQARQNEETALPAKNRSATRTTNSFGVSGLQIAQKLNFVFRSLQKGQYEFSVTGYVFTLT